ncbi:hypothetical protein TheveDRAFT_0929 [Thermanaerovibrio velox DSM 12556]|uniref:Uncharacterized protein n=1 Tax=Thermanaerovibrio velox DSM 12556 TaxID=926567 RepID=H0URX6_9BACT|nr:hypothetical protein [Thermanaerovibrio velox]EHM10065.1 hypothetical protein TheveDRAFT_0929 [Thermanaerovibrio velox DSM 12556]
MEGIDNRSFHSVFAFVGPAGTGKSQRAQMVAASIGAEYIIDDGLVIRRGQIVCGKSAKAERNQVRAIRRAMFEFEDHRQAVSDFFAKAAPSSVMIIATSEGMAFKVASRLGLRRPERVIRIEEVSTPEEIAKARRERRGKGQHVIPVSHVQVRRNFAGKLVGRLKVLWRPKEGSYDGEKTIVRPPFNFIGALHIEPQAVGEMITHIALLTHQVEKVIQVKVKPEDEGVSVQLDLGMRPGEKTFLEVMRQVRRRVILGVRYFTGIEISHFDVIVSEVCF